MNKEYTDFWMKNCNAHKHTFWQIMSLRQYLSYLVIVQHAPNRIPKIMNIVCDFCMWLQIQKTVQ